MKSRTKLTAFLLVTAMTASVFAGCAKESATADNPSATDKTADNKPKEPVTVTMYNHFNNISEDRIQQFLIEPLKQKLPHVTLQVIKHEKGSTLEELVAAGSFPDLYYGSNVGFISYLTMNLQNNMNDLFKKHNVDLGRFEPWSTDAIKLFGNNGEMYGIPFSANYGALLYNKDIFDRFGVPYPKDGMTWDEVTDLGRKLTRVDNGVQYIGFDPGTVSNMASGISLTYLDEKANKSLFNNEDWKRIFAQFKNAYSAPGYVQNGKFDYGMNGFVKDKVVAMLPVWALQVLNAQKELEGMNWDMVTVPNFKERLGQGRSVDIHMLAVSSVSKNKDAAMEVLKVITSDEVQMKMSQLGTPSVLKNEEIKKSYGTQVAQYKGKNSQALFKTKPGAPYLITKNENLIRAFPDNARKELATGSKDVNTVAREMEEQANQKLAEAK
ncbi:ABC transporter substrate-binding protein [Paenibacillus allorhizosphaerae]|uniref:Extracellular solute-binding protein n=1 Tax=Paenibacillus allorhizosphaerae TaxID=2849866 RepID=A0ABN7TKB6_9BACL|nr:extracellular solute-binding protein [Paenibacillus allorhizosphaerae]CAG7643202.1 hypothetical protein PAECIP111802_02970 [Paenibacillus allorhizosphaerae]